MKALVSTLITILVLPAISIAAERSSVTRSQRAKIKAAVWTILENQGAEPILSPEVTSLKISDSTDNNVAVEFSAVEMGPYEYNCAFLFNLSTNKYDGGTVRCGNAGTKVYPKLHCEDQAVLEVAKIYKKSISDLDILTTKTGETRKTISLKVELISSWATDSASGEDLEATYEVTLEKSGCKKLSLVEQKN